MNDQSEEASTDQLGGTPALARGDGRGLEPPTATAIRAELEELVRLDLLGPKNGPDEEIDESRVSDRYLVGMLAPRYTFVGADQDDKHEADTDRGAGGDDDDDPVTPRHDSMFPSSLGMTFVVDAACEELVVDARWGRYVRTGSATLTTDAGNPKKVWKRIPQGDEHVLQLEADRIEPFAPDAGQPMVRVRGRIRARDDQWLVTLFLVNEQPRPEERLDEAWIFQVELAVSASDGAPVFLRKDDPRDLSGDDPLAREDREMAMLYRRHGEFAVGHGIAVTVDVAPDDAWRATRIRTVAVPAHEVEQQTPRTVADPGSEMLADVPFDMKVLAEAEPSELPGMLTPLLDGYGAWIDVREAEKGDPDAHLDGFEDYVDRTLGRCRRALERMRDGVALLGSDELAAAAFQFANRAMWHQRVHSTAARLRRRGDSRWVDEIVAEVDAEPKNRSWYPFQLAFFLLNLASLTRLDHPERVDPSGAVADLLWFPTGGGKTEAYLGLAAYTMALRRLQGTIEGRIGGRGLAVLMRYTLRLLTLQQFQRATALLCSCEVIRREALAAGDERWGNEPFRIGLWVGQRATPNTTEQAAEAIDRDHGHYKPGGVGGSGSPAQLTNCPWCGSRIEPGKHLRVERFASGRGRTLTFCGDKLGRCPFTPKQSPGEGLPVVVVDEEIYRLLPAMIVATVDKFAQLPWNGRTQMLFGQVDGLCERHGFRSPDVEDADSHPKRKELPAAKTIAHPDLRPPDLIIQDELHLISGPLGSLVGLYETAVDELCSWEVDGKRVRPKVVASTATVRNAKAQVHHLFLRQLEVFPPPGTDVSDNFFSVRREVSEATPGRRYLGVCAPGRRLKAALIRVYMAHLAGAQLLYEKYGKHADPWMTAVGYFNSLRELAGMRRLIDDDVANRVWKMDVRGLGKRRLGAVEELTSRRGSTDIPAILDRMEVPFDPVREAERKERRKKGLRVEPGPFDVLLATNMISVGVDVDRLGLMIVGGQPKATAEYIQATSRVGRRHPGLVCTVYNWARPRDLSHYERFEHYHATFYQQVESLSVTPFAARALDRGLSALLVALVRNLGPELNGNQTARDLVRDHPHVARAQAAIVARAEGVSQRKEFGEEVAQLLERRLDEWLRLAGKTATLAYKRRKGLTVPLMHQPDDQDWRPFTCLNSLREVEPSSGIVLVDDGL